MYAVFLCCKIDHYNLNLRFSQCIILILCELDGNHENCLRNCNVLIQFFHQYANILALLENTKKLLQNHIIEP